MFVFGFRAQMSSKPCVGFPRISSENQFLRRKTDSYVGFRRIFFLVFFGRFLFFLSYFGIFQKVWVLYVFFCFFWVCGGEGPLHFCFFFFFLVLAIYFFLVFRFFTLILSFLDSGAKVDKTTQLIFKMEFTKTKDRTDFL